MLRQLRMSLSSDVFEEQCFGQPASAVNCARLSASEEMRVITYGVHENLQLALVPQCGLKDDRHTFIGPMAFSSLAGRVPLEILFLGQIHSPSPVSQGRPRRILRANLELSCTLSAPRIYSTTSKHISRLHGFGSRWQAVATRLCIACLRLYVLALHTYLCSVQSAVAELTSFSAMPLCWAELKTALASLACSCHAPFRL